MTTIHLRAIAVLALAAAANAQFVERLDVSTTGAIGNGHWTEVRISDDARYVAFRSLAGNLSIGDDLGTWDIFLRDRTAGTTVNLTHDGAEWSQPELSADGRFVVFRRGGQLAPGQLF